jgi:gliding motility-associated lipoprotein GldH
MPRQLIKYIGFLVFIFLSSCGLNYTYNENVTIEDGKWFKDDAVHFKVLIDDSLTGHNFYLSLRNDTDYRFSNLFVFLTTHFPNGNITRDTIECVMADNSGKWMGKGWGNIKENKILLNQNIRFPVTGQYEFFVQQAMREDTLEGIHSVGLIIEKAE